MPVIEIKRCLKAPGRKFEGLLEFFGALADSRNGFHVFGFLEGPVVHYQKCMAVLMKQGGFAEAAVVGVFVDEALALTVDQDSAFECPGLGDGQGNRNGIHVDGCGSSGDPETYAAPVIPCCRNAHPAAQGEGRVIEEHLVVQYEASRRQDDTPTRANPALLSKTSSGHPLDLAVAVLIERRATMICRNPGGTSVDGGAEFLHQQWSALVFYLRDVAPRCRAGDLPEGVNVLRPGPN